MYSCSPPSFSCQVDRRRGLLLVNGARLVVAGVNRHEHDPDRAIAVPPGRLSYKLAAAPRTVTRYVAVTRDPTPPLERLHGLPLQRERERERERWRLVVDFSVLPYVTPHRLKVPPGLMELDAALLRRHNFNAVRTSHYPNHPYWSVVVRYGR